MVSGVFHNKSTLVTSRFLSSIGGRVDFVTVLPITSDIWPPEQLGQSFALVNAIPLLGSALGPLLGGAIADIIGWRLICWVAAIFRSALMLFALAETSHAKILGDKALRLSASTGRAQYTHTTLSPTPTLSSPPLAPRMPKFTVPIKTSNIEERASTHPS